MCGVFGFVAGKNTTAGPDLGRLRDIALTTTARGKDSFGFAWVDGFGTIRSFKQTGDLADHLGILALARGARMLIGHCRYATHGDPADNQNNHPHPLNGGWYVHNGVVKDYASLVRAWRLFPQTDCDSEVLGLLAELQGGTNPTRLIHACAATREAPLVSLGLWARPRSLVAIRRGNPLVLGTHKGDVYLASLRKGLPMDAQDITDRTAVIFDRRGVNHVSF